MKAPARPPLSPADLRDLTPARVAIGRAGVSLPTSALLGFTLDHARARDAVHAVFDTGKLMSDLHDLGFATFQVASRALDRGEYLRRPDLGRLLDSSSERALADRAGKPGDVAMVIGDGLSPTAVNAHAAKLVGKLLPRLVADQIGIDHVVIASGARVALGDEIGTLLGARMVVVLIGERPGLSAPDSLGAYLTFAPRIGATDAERNCVSNIHRGGLGYEEAAGKIVWLIREGLARRMTGVALKDESAGGATRHIAMAPGLI